MDAIKKETAMMKQIFLTLINALLSLFQVRAAELEGRNYATGIKYPDVEEELSRNGTAANWQDRCRANGKSGNVRARFSYALQKLADKLEPEGIMKRDKGSYTILDIAKLKEFADRLFEELFVQFISRYKLNASSDFAGSDIADEAASVLASDLILSPKDVECAANRYAENGGELGWFFKSFYAEYNDSLYQAQYNAGGSSSAFNNSAAKSAAANNSAWGLTPKVLSKYEFYLALIRAILALPEVRAAKDAGKNTVSGIKYEDIKRELIRKGINVSADFRGALKYLEGILRFCPAITEEKDGTYTVLKIGTLETVASMLHVIIATNGRCMF